MVACSSLRLAALTAVLLAVTAGAPREAQSQPLPQPDFFGIQRQIYPNPACVEQEPAVLFTACRCNVELLEAGRSPTDGVYLNARVHPDVACIDCDPDTLAVSLGKLAAGEHSFLVTMRAAIVSGDSTQYEAIHRETLRLTVYPTCPPPPSGNPPMVEEVFIGLGPPCPLCPAWACAGDSIPVVLRGYTFDTCTEFVGVDVLHPLVRDESLYPAVPSLRVRFRTGSCYGSPCALVTTPWSATVMIPPLPQQLDPPYQLLVESDLTDACVPDSMPMLLGAKHFPFFVSTCPVPAPDCFELDWEQPGYPVRCDAVVSEGAPARVTMTLLSSRLVAGIEGTLRLEPPDLEITDVTPVGAADSMKVDWIQTETGARFVLFTVDGSSITPVSPPSFQPILEVEVAAKEGHAIPEFTRLFATELIVSDVLGQVVYPCPTPELVLLLPPHASICRASLCDMNEDGEADVRDLVLLARCVLGFDLCPEPPSSEPIDCDLDGAWELDDVFCCARVVLNGDQPDSTSGDPDPGVVVSLGAPRDLGAGEVVVPIRVQGADRLGAARLNLSYPVDRYEPPEVAFPESGPDWLTLSQVGAEGLALGFIGLQAGEALSPVELSAEVRLRLRPGQTPGGELTLASSEFTGREGAALWQGEETPSVPLAPFTGVRLTSPRPNPFQQTVRFTVQLSEAGAVEVGVYDATGRRVAQLFQGRAEPGAFDLEWQGRADDGSVSPSGVYWLRGTAGGVTTAQKILFLRGR